MDTIFVMISLGNTPSLRVSRFLPRFCPHFRHLDDLFARQNLIMSTILFTSCWVQFQSTTFSACRWSFCPQNWPNLSFYSDLVGPVFNFERLPLLILFDMQNFSFSKIHLKMLSSKWWLFPFCIRGLTLIPEWISNYTPIIKCEITYLFPHINAVALKFGNGWVIPWHTLLGMWLLIHAVIKINPF